jgi:hypothetical protein
MESRNNDAPSHRNDDAQPLKPLSEDFARKAQKASLAARGRAFANGNKEEEGDDKEYIAFLESELTRLEKINRKQADRIEQIEQWMEDENIYEVHQERIWLPGNALLKYAERLEESQKRARQKKKFEKRTRQRLAEAGMDKICKDMVAYKRAKFEEEEAEKK